MRTFAFASALLVCSQHLALAAPTIQALYLEGSTLPGADDLPGFLSTDIVRNNGSARATVNAYGDLIARVHTKLGNFDAQNNTIYYYFGALAGETPLALRREAMLEGVYQNILGTSTGIAADGTLTYNASLGSGLSGPATLWRDDTLIYQEGDAIPAGPLAGKFFGGNASSVFTRPNGDSIWRMTYRDTSGGPEVGTAILQSTNAFNPILQSGDAIGKLGNLGPTSTFSNIGYSIAGTKLATAASLDTGEQVAIVDNMPQQFASGGFLVEDSLIPFADGGLTDDGTATGTPIETLVLGSNYAVNERGTFAFNAFTELTNDGDTNVDSDVLIYNGRVLFREGDTIDGVQLSGQFEGLDLNDRGDVVFGWDDRIYLWNATTYPDGTLLAELGTPLALPNGDPGTVRSVAVSQITATNQVAAGGDNLPVIYFGGSTNPGDFTSLMRLEPAPVLEGDFNQDGVVNLADYTVWRDSLNSQSILAADANRDAVVDGADYLVWRQNFGAQPPPSAALATVPEPPAAVWIAACLMAIAFRRKR